MQRTPQVLHLIPDLIHNGGFKAWCAKKKVLSFRRGPLKSVVAATYSPGSDSSTIGVTGLNGSVRYG
ncbi:hypothetical protein ACFPMF_27550, partial [Larkinella bovis]